ncbi:MAG: hypothetical protein ACREMB_12460, partial [Candidatus Rokuibacteriota bacterium]
MPEPGTPAALVQGLVAIALLLAAALATGLGVLALLRLAPDPSRRLVLAPFAATLVWALSGNLLVRFGLTMAQATPWIGAASLGLAVPGLVSLARRRPRPVVVATLAGGIGLAVGLVAWPYFARGLTAHVGAVNPDTAYITATATAYWHYGLDGTAPRPPYFERLAPHLNGLGPARNHSYVLLALFSLLVRAGDTLFVRNLLACWSILVLACSLAFYWMSWRTAWRATDTPPGRPGALVAYVVLTVAVGWAAVPALVGNWDNALLVSVGPVLAGLVAEARRGSGFPLFLGATAAYGVYTYPELAPILGLILLPLYLPPPAEVAPRRLVLGYAAAAGIALVVLAPGVKPLWRFVEGQRAAAVAPGMRPGGAFAAGLATSPGDPSAWWALGAEHGARQDARWPRVYGTLLAGLVLTGVLRLARHGHWRQVAAFGLMTGGLVYFMLVDRYGYAAYKVLTVGWWLVGHGLVEGGVAVLAAAGAGPGPLGLFRRRAAVGALALLFVACIVASERRRVVEYFQESVLPSQPSLAALARLRSAAASQPATDVLVTGALDHPFALPWIFYALRDTPLRAYHEATRPHPVPGGAPWPEGPLPRSLLLPSPDVRGVPHRFTTGEFALVDLASSAVIVHVESPNGLERWGTWLGTEPITISLLGGAALPVALTFEARPGPSRPESARRRLVLRAGPRELGRLEIDRPTSVAFRFVTRGGRETVALSTPDTPTVAAMPNGDTRPLLVSIRHL